MTYEAYQGIHTEEIGKIRFLGENKNEQRRNCSQFIEH